MSFCNSEPIFRWSMASFSGKGCRRQSTARTVLVRRNFINEGRLSWIVLLRRKNFQTPFFKRRKNTCAPSREDANALK